MTLILSLDIRAAEGGVIFVAGSSVYSRPSPADAIESLRTNGQLAFARVQY